VFTLVPIVWGFLLSLSHAQNTIRVGHFVGFANFVDLLTDEAFLRSLLTIVVFAAFIVPLTYVVSLGLALLVDQAGFGRPFFRTVFFISAAVSYVVASLIWKMSIFNGLPFGFANRFLAEFGVDPIAWIGTAQPPWYWLVLVTARLWLQVGFFMIIFLAGLQEISRSIYEAAAVDGARAGRCCASSRFRSCAPPRFPSCIATVTLVFQMLFSSMAGFALARIPARGRNIVFFLILSTLMIPGAVTFVPSYAVMAFLGGVNTRWGIIAPGLFSAFSIFLFRQFYLRFPTEIEEAGRLDGLSYFGVYWRLLLPNSTSIVMALGILTFIGSWNSFLWPLVIGQDPSAWTVQVVLSTFLTAQTINISQLFAAAAVGVAPLVLVFLLMQRYIVEGAKFSSGKE